mmetsp:Transcript_9129/g.22372  ORF Transcript_9129/g.22372 Transcript_9129/m.22372 type:complete len:217 (+) Transcript_9129:2692-3342(+)
MPGVGTHRVSTCSVRISSASTGGTCRWSSTTRRIPRSCTPSSGNWWTTRPARPSSTWDTTSRKRASRATRKRRRTLSATIHRRSRRISTPSNKPSWRCCGFGASRATAWFDGKTRSGRATHRGSVPSPSASRRRVRTNPPVDRRPTTTTVRGSEPSTFDGEDPTGSILSPAIWHRGLRSASCPRSAASTDRWTRNTGKAGSTTGCWPSASGPWIFR